MSQYIQYSMTAKNKMMSDKKILDHWLYLVQVDLYWQHTSISEGVQTTSHADLWNLQCADICLSFTYVTLL